MGCGWGYRFYRNTERRDDPVRFMELSPSYWVHRLFLCFSGGILGWDPVHTTCIPDEMMMRL